MRFVAQPVDNEDGDVAYEFSDFGRDRRTVWEVDGAGATVAIQTKAGGGDSSVGDGEGDKGDRAKIKGALDPVGFWTDVGSVAVVDVESVIEGFVET